jgi:hypothetical protein
MSPWALIRIEDTSSANVEQFVTTKPVVGVGGPALWRLQYSRRLTPNSFLWIKSSPTLAKIVAYRSKSICYNWTPISTRNKRILSPNWVRNASSMDFPTIKLYCHVQTNPLRQWFLGFGARSLSTGSARLFPLSDCKWEGENVLHLGYNISRDLFNSNIDRQQWISTKGPPVNWVLLSKTKIFLHFCLNNQHDALIIQIHSVIKLYMFRASSLPIIRSFLLYIRHW